MGQRWAGSHCLGNELSAGGWAAWVGWDLPERAEEVLGEDMRLYGAVGRI